MTPRDTYHVMLWNEYNRAAERILETFSGGLEAREEAVAFADGLSRLREQLTMLGVTFSAHYEIRIQQVRRHGALGGPLYAQPRKRFLAVTPESDAEEEARFWADDPDESVARTIEAGRDRMRHAAGDPEGESPF